jgi:ATP-dependent Zn protease
MSEDHRPALPDSHRRDRATRRPMAPWDRLKVLTLLVGAWVVMLWSVVASNPNVTLRTALVYSTRAYGWILFLAALECARQLHYLLSENSQAWHEVWTESIFGGFNRWAGSLNPWNRYRASRALKLLFLVVILDLVLARLLALHPAVAIFQAPLLLMRALPTILQFLVYMFLLVSQFAAVFWFLSRGGVDVYMPDDVKTRFSDVWGQDQVLEKVKENVMFLEAPDKIEEKGGFVPGGILLWGPPGSGKTLIAEAVAGETGRPFVFVEPSAFIQMFMGIGPLKVKSLFRKLRKLALRYGGVIVFFDEADSLGRRGSGIGGAWNPQPAGWSISEPACNGLSYLSPSSAWLAVRGDQVASHTPDARPGLVNRIVAGMGMGDPGMGSLQALLTEMSGLKKPRGFVNRYVRRALGMRPKPPPKYRILVMMATNMPQALDEALLRPGRLDRIYKVGYPSKAGRLRTYEGYFAKVRHNLTADEMDRLATITPYATGATIKDLVNEALIASIRDGRDWITWEDVIRARLLKSLGPPDDVEYIERERHAVAVHEACHAVVAYRVRRHLTIDIATIEKGSSYLGMVKSIPLEEQFTQWKTEYESDIMVALAAHIGEKMFFDGDSSSGVTGDLEAATYVAMYMEAYWGMGKTIGSHLAAKGRGQEIIDGLSRNLLETELGHRIESRLHELVDRTRVILEANRLEVLAVAHALESHKTLTGEDVAAVIEGREGPLVDGRPYRAPQFADVAEAYHSRAVDAHKRHGRVELALPVFTGHVTTENVASNLPEREL